MPNAPATLLVPASNFSKQADRAFCRSFPPSHVIASLDATPCTSRCPATPSRPSVSRAANHFKPRAGRHTLTQSGVKRVGSGPVDVRPVPPSTDFPSSAFGDSINTTLPRLAPIQLCLWLPLQSPSLNPRSRGRLPGREFANSCASSVGHLPARRISCRGNNLSSITHIPEPARRPALSDTARAASHFSATRCAAASWLTNSRAHWMRNSNSSTSTRCRPSCTRIGAMGSVVF